jgi:crossover junction endodeoxyribonuclease RuvC
MATTRILGIDPGLRTTGFGVIDCDGPALRYVASGTIRSDAGTQALARRLGTIFDGVTELAARYRPHCASVEIVFVNINPQSTLLLGQARGAALTALVASELDVAEYSALQMKKAIVGHGKASKSQIQQMVMRLLALPGLPGTDAADALGLAICHAHAARSFAALARGGALAGSAPLRWRHGRAR